MRRRRNAGVRPVTVLGLDHVQVAAPPGWEAEARRFYGGLLGLAELEKPEPLLVSDVEELAERLVGAGVEVRWDEALPAVRRFYVTDPWGNRVELVAAS